MMASVGENVTLRCIILQEHSDPITWYKQTAGHQPLAVAMTQKLAQTPVFFNNFQPSHFSIEVESETCNLKIYNVTSSDEATYYCGWRKYETYFGRGTYLALKGSKNNQHKSKVSVVQHPASHSVRSGDALMLICSVLSEHSTEDIKMFWFRSDSGDKPVPEILYTNNQSLQCESDFTHSCTFNLSINTVSQMDTGTYYCAVATCGRILFGNGTKINMVEPVDHLLIILGVLLGLCVVVIIAQIISRHIKERHYNDEGLYNSERRHPSNQEQDTGELNYAALNVIERKHRRVHRKAETPQDGFYSQVNYSSVTDLSTAEPARQ
ncbi:novel immune-type receptor 13 isoform X1 [Danio rerio]|uniref:Novel immune-type receptor 13 isoform X1 n=39 Tax=Danio rerio TaxID=7955 RepID=A0AC58H5A4_DANRE